MPLQMRALSTKVKPIVWRPVEGLIINARGVNALLYLLRATQMQSLKSCLLVYLIAVTLLNLLARGQSQTQLVSKSWAARGALAKLWAPYVQII